MDTDLTRRRLLGSGAAFGAAALAGCTDGGSGTSTGTSTATATDGDGEPAATDDGGAPTATPGTETVTFSSRADTEITGTLYGTGDCAVVLVPQINLDRESWRPQAERLADAGHLALAIDEDPDARAASVLGAVDHLRSERSVTQLVLVGASTGGEAVVKANAAAEDGAVGGVVALSAAGGADRAGELQGRKLFVVAEGDEDRFVQTARELHENAPDPSRLVTYEGSAHGQGLFDSPHGEDLWDELSGVVGGVCGG